MIFKIRLSVKQKNLNMIPASYQYELSSAIYKIMASSDAEYSTWLHDNGFQNEKKKRFKFFCFSNLQIPKYEVKKDCLHILSDSICFYISFLPERSTMTFVQGTFVNKQLTLGNRKTRTEFYIETIELAPFPAHISEGTFKTLSPLCISLRTAEGEIKYLSPEHEEAGQRIVSNLREKYRFYYGKEFEGDTSFEFKLLSIPKRKGIMIKVDTPQQSKVIGYLCQFYLKCDRELMKIMMMSGVGEKGSSGFGFVTLR